MNTKSPEKGHDVVESPNPIDAVKILEAGFKRLPKMFEGMDRNFYGDFPFHMSLLKGVGRRLFRTLQPKSLDSDPIPVKLDTITGIKQRSDADCVGASFMSAFNAITEMPATPDLYDQFLQAAVENRLATEDSQGTQVLPFVMNVFSTPEFRRGFPASEVTVALKRGLSLEELSEIIRTTKARTNPAYKLFVFLPFASWTKQDGGHMVTLREINPLETTVYDPKAGEQRVLPNAEFNQKWEYDKKSAIFVFSAQKGE